MSKSLDMDKIKALMAKPVRQKKTKKLERTYRVWFELPTAYGDCQNEDCLAPDPEKRQMVTTIEGYTMCRYCFLVGYGPQDEETQLDISPRTW